MPVEIKKISEYIWEVPTTAKEGMLVPARIYATEELLKGMDRGVFEQVTNVACLPGIQKYAICMPDGHWGYGFPIGGVAAMDTETGVISPGGIGFDINCGMRLIRTNLTAEEVKPKLRTLVDRLFQAVPCGVGCKGFLKLSEGEFREVMVHGVPWAVKRGYGWPEDTERIEDYGCIPGADPDKVSMKAMSRGIHQLGTLGSGNHYLEIQVAHAENIYDRELAKILGIDRDQQVVVMFHCGSRGFGHQVGTDYLEIFGRAMKRYGIAVRDRELACAPYRSPEGQDYFKAMAAAANSAFVNRQVITHRVREVFSEVFQRDARELGLEMVYDVAHNIAKLERYKVNGEEKELVIHRKGATRSFAPGRPELAERYRAIGQPVIIGGSMETGSYLLIGTQTAMEESFGSTAHGSGRTMSRTAAKKKVHGRDLLQRLEEKGIYVRAASFAGVAEEAGIAYKDISAVVEALDKLGISKKVVRLQPIGNIKG
jgi:tRNA-splicing ligase RtcB